MKFSSRALLQKVGIALATALLLTGAGKGGCGPDVLQLQLDGLEPLGQGSVYEGWLIKGGKPVPAGRFRLAEGQSEVEFVFRGDDLADVTAYVLTIEPEVDNDPGPSAIHVLAGDFTGDRAELSAAHPAVFGDDFSGASGGFILATPSTSAIADDYRLGIWYVDPSGPKASLSLPVLPQGWVYEGWVAGAEGAVSTGRFTDVAMADADGKGPTAGPDGSPPFPGQDFIQPPMDLVGKLAVISIEPEPDDSPAPFAFKPLVSDPAGIKDAGAGVLQALVNNAADFPTGVATRR
jgi:hypothetical protein